MLILLLVTVGATVADLLNKIAHGRVAADLLLALIGLRTVDALTLLVPLAVFLGVQLAYGRLYRESEMAVFAASGLPVTGLVRPLLLLARAADAGHGADLVLARAGVGAPGADAAGRSEPLADRGRPRAGAFRRTAEQRRRDVRRQR